MQQEAGIETSNTHKNGAAAAVQRGFQWGVRRGLLIAAFILVLSLAACLGLSDASKRYNSGVVLLEEGWYEEAIAEFDLALFLDGSMTAAFYNRALAQQRTGRLASAIKDYTRAIELSPDLALAYASRNTRRIKSDMTFRLNMDNFIIDISKITGRIITHCHNPIPFSRDFILIGDGGEVRSTKNEMAI